MKAIDKTGTRINETGNGLESLIKYVKTNS